MREIVSDIFDIIEQGQRAAYASVSQAMIDTYWRIDKRIVEEEQNGALRAEYGERLIDDLAEKITQKYEKGYSPRYLRSFRLFYAIAPDYQIWKSRFPNLTWTHVYRSLRVEEVAAAKWYMMEASREMWSVRELDRNISTQYYERHLSLPNSSSGENSGIEHAPEKLEILKSPVVAEFLGFKQDGPKRS